MDKIPSMYVPSFLRLALCFHLSCWNYFNLDLHYIAPLNRSCFLSASSEDDNSPNEANVETFLFKLDIQPFFYDKSQAVAIMTKGRMSAMTPAASDSQCSNESETW